MARTIWKIFMSWILIPVLNLNRRNWSIISSD
jgi:hypothetical protein